MDYLTLTVFKRIKINERQNTRYTLAIVLESRHYFLEVTR